jgi:hypothetical protein
MRRFDLAFYAFVWDFLGFLLSSFCLTVAHKSPD